MTPLDALTEGLYLSLTAPTDEKARMAADLCESLASTMSPGDVEVAKTRALARADQENMR